MGDLNSKAFGSGAGGAYAAVGVPPGFPIVRLGSNRAGVFAHKAESDLPKRGGEAIIRD